MDALVIKYKNNEYIVKCLTHDYHAFLYELENKLKNNYFNHNYFQAYFSFPYKLNMKQLYQLYTLCDLYHTYILGFKQENKTKQIKLQHELFKVGNNYKIAEDIIYIGNIEKDVYIQSNSNIYVLGVVEGVIDMLYPELIISASSFNNAKIRIFDSTFQIMTKSEPSSVYYKDSEISYL